MSPFARILAQPRTQNLFRVLRLIEREYPEKARIGDSASLAQEAVLLEQDPFMEFPDANIAEASLKEDGRLRLSTRFLGFFGPQGALPLYVTELASQWKAGRDPSFARFADIIATRFQQLFFRVWANARPVAQAERPDQDRFRDYLSSLGGFGTPAMQDRSAMPDQPMLSYIGLLGMQVKTVRGLGQMIHGLFGIEAIVEEWVGSWLKFEPEDLTILGRNACCLGVDTCLGSGIYSINEKVAIRIKCENFAQYESFLPGGVLNDKLTGAVAFYLGYRHAVEIRLGLAAYAAPAITLGRSGKLGWTSWLGQAEAAGGETHRYDAHFDIQAVQ
jgi:type VI secretion system protein ImpH